MKPLQVALKVPEFEAQAHAQTPDPPALVPEAPPSKAAVPIRRPLRSVALSLAVAVPLMAVTARRTPAAEGHGWQSMLDAIRTRASVKLAEDFREDLRRWAGADGWSKSWSMDQAGFVHPGQLAIHIKSVPLADYDVEFLGSVDRKGLGFVYRAMDFENYYAARIVIVKAGPIPEVALERYAVIRGQAGPRTRIALPFPVRMDTLYHVQIEAKGDHFTTRINDQFVDAFSDSRLSSGGVGFFCGPGEASRVCWLRLAGHDDLLGEVCSLIAPRFGS
jgi:hypothetical protein